MTIKHDAALKAAVDSMRAKISAASDDRRLSIWQINVMLDDMLDIIEMLAEKVEKP